MDQPSCPTCKSLLTSSDDHIICTEGHRFTADGLALAGNLIAVRALWLAILALEDDAAGLEWLLRQGRAPAHHQESLAAQAAEGRAAARVLREHARAAQERLDNLPVAPSKLRGANT